MKGKQTFSKSDVAFLIRLIQRGMQTEEELTQVLSLVERLAVDASPSGLLSLLVTANKLREAYAKAHRAKGGTNDSK